MNLMMIVTDLGRMKAFRITRDDDDPTESPAFTDLADDNLENRHSKVSNRVTDQAGRFPSGKGGMAVGERHSEEEEARHTQLQAIAGRINRIASGENTPIYLAAPPTILHKLLDELTADVRQRIGKDLALDLVKAPKLDLLKRFGLA